MLIHGLSIPGFVYRDVAPELAAKGLRVLVYGEQIYRFFCMLRWALTLGCVDLYGRGYSDAPETTYDIRLYITQLALLMQHVKWDKAVVAGLSMVCASTSYGFSLSLLLDQGGSIAAAFTANFPDLVEDRAIVISSAGLIQVRCYLSTVPSRTLSLTYYARSPVIFQGLPKSSLCQSSRPSRQAS